MDAQGNLNHGKSQYLKLLGYDSLDEILKKNIAETFYQNPIDRKN
jgi:hypothetical protein